MRRGSSTRTTSTPPPAPSASPCPPTRRRPRDEADLGGGRARAAVPGDPEAPRRAPSSAGASAPRCCEAADPEGLRRGVGAGGALRAAGLRGHPRRRRLAPLDARQLPRRRGAPARLVHRAQAAPVAAALRHGPGGRGALGPGPRRARATAARRAGLPRHLPGGDQARPPRRPRLPDRGQRPLVALDRPGHRGAGSTCRYACLPRRRRAAPAPAPARAPRAGCAGCSLSQATWRASAGRGAPGRVDGGGAFLRALRPPIIDGVLDPRDPRPALALYARQRPAPAPWLRPAHRRRRRARPAFAPRARWVLETLAEGLGRRPAFVTRRRGRPGLRRASRPPPGPGSPPHLDAQAFFEGTGAVPGPGRPPRARADPALPAGPPRGRRSRATWWPRAFYLLARWDELRVPERDRFGRLPLAASAFGRDRRPRPGGPAGGGLPGRPARGRCGSRRRRAWSVALTHDIDRVRRRTARGLAGHRPPRRAARPWPARVGRDPWDNVPDLLGDQRPGAGCAPTVFLIGRNAHPLDGTPAARSTSATAAGPGRRRARRRRRGGPARGVRLVGGRPAALAARARRACAPRSGPVAGVRFHYLRFRYHETVRWLEDAGAGLRLQPGLQRGARVRRAASRGPSGPGSWARSAPARLRAAAAGGDGHHPALAPRPRRRGRRATRALRVLERVRDAGGRVALLWHNTYLADDRAPGYGARSGSELLDELGERGARLGPAGRRSPAPAAARLDGAAGAAPDHGPPPPRRAHLPQGGARAGRGRGRRAGAGASRAPVRAGAGASPPGWRWRGGRARATPTLYHVHDPGAAAGRALARRAPPAARSSTTSTSTWARRRAPSGGCPARCACPWPWRPSGPSAPRARRLDGVVTVNEDLAARFAAAGARAGERDQLPVVRRVPAEPAPLPDEPVVLYVGGLGPLRGLEVMRAAFPLVRRPGRPPGAGRAGRPGPAARPARSTWAPWTTRRCRASWPRARGGLDPAAAPRQLRSRGADEAGGGDGRRTAGGGRATWAGWARWCAPPAAGCVVPPDDPEAHAAALTRLLVRPRGGGPHGRRRTSARSWTGLAFEAAGARG